MNCQNQNCYNLIQWSGRGRKKRFCSDACRKAFSRSLVSENAKTDKTDRVLCYVDGVNNRDGMPFIAEIDPWPRPWLDEQNRVAVIFERDNRDAIVCFGVYPVEKIKRVAI